MGSGKSYQWNQFTTVLINGNSAINGVLQKWSNWNPSSTVKIRWTMNHTPNYMFINYVEFYRPSGNYTSSTGLCIKIVYRNQTSYVTSIWRFCKITKSNGTRYSVQGWSVIPETADDTLTIGSNKITDISGYTNQNNVSNVNLSNSATRWSHAIRDRFEFLLSLYFN